MPRALRVVQPQTAMDDHEWKAEIAQVEVAVSLLLAAKKKTLGESPTREQVLWIRYEQRLKRVKRLLDAAVL